MQMQKGGEIGHEGENYVSAIDGNDLVLTVDFTIQSIVEKYLEEAVNSVLAQSFEDWGTADH